MRKVIAAVLLTGAMLVACTLYVSDDPTRIRPDGEPDDGFHGTLDAGLTDGRPGDGHRPPRSDAGPPDDGPFNGDGGVLQDGGEPLPCDGGLPPDDGPLPPDDGPFSSDGPLPPGDGPRPH